ncbi:hypothetical protein IAT38_001130 [Cryptococcus sp. DSM 104549]
MHLENLDDGSKLEAAWYESLSTSLTYFRALLSSHSSSAWKPVSVLPLTASSTAHDTGKSSARGSSLGKIEASDVVVHRRSGKAGEVYRAVVEVECGSDVSVDTFRGCLVTPETRPMWDRMVEEATTLDLLDAHTRVTKTNYRLGWPSSPRDAVMISKTLVDQHTLVDITTSLPRSRHEPAYLRPAPPYVRAHVALQAWCIQLPSSSQSLESPPEGKARITCFWSWNPKGAWAVGGGVPQHLPSLVVGLVDYVRDGSEKVPVLLGYGPDVSIGSVGYDTSRVTLSVKYAIVSGGENQETEDLRRQVEFGLSSTQSWDVQISVKTQHGSDSSSTVWSSFVGQAPTPNIGSAAPKRLILRFAHAQLEPGEELVRIQVSIERTTSATAGVRINGVPVAVEQMEAPALTRPLLEDTASMTGISLRTMSTTVDGNGGAAASGSGSREGSVVMRRSNSEKSAAAQKGISSLIRRNYIYFTSLLQEPEPKWKPVLDSRGVAIHQLDSIDKTLVVFRAEAVFVGVGIWDLFAVISSPGARLVWDKTHEDATLVEDVNELTDVWHLQSKAAWPVSARDSVMLRTTYKSPSSVHLFGFSVDDTDLFPRIPPITDPTVIRTQIDLQGWSIESLSPNTTQVTLLEQSDPRGWSGKSSIPQVMMSTLAGIGEFAIKHGAPPIATRLGGAKALGSRYDVEKETFKYEYQPAEARRSKSSSTSTSFPLPNALRSPDLGSEASSLRSVGEAPSSAGGNIECEIRCDADQWSNSFAIVIDPPQQAISALRRHRLSSGGGGLWLTVEHDPALLKGEGKVVITVRRGPVSQGSSKTSVTVNGSKIKVDVEDLPETQVQLLKKQKRGRPTRAPLDQPPGLGTVRKKQSIMDMKAASAAAADPGKALLPTSAIAKVAMPFNKWYSAAAETTRVAIIPMTAPTLLPEVDSTPVDAAVRALGQLARIHGDRDGESTDPNGWLPVSDRDGLKIEKRTVSHVSETFPVFRAGRIIEGFTAEEVSATVSSLRADERFEKPTVLESYGHGVTTSHVVAHTTFPFRGRSMLVAAVVARMPDPPPPSPSLHGPQTPLSTIFHASSSSFDPAATDLDPSKYNPASLPTGNVVLEGWILETIDPYSHEQYAIPSTRCMYVASVNYSGNMPLSVNNMLNASLPRSLLSIESILKSSGPPSRARTPHMMVLAPEEKSVGPWGLASVPGHHTGVDQRNDDGRYSMTVTIQPSSSFPATQTAGDDTLSPTLKHIDSRSSMNTGRSTVIDLAEDIRKSRKDLVVLEVEVGSAAVKSGCDVEISAVSLPVALHSRASPVATASSDTSVLPLQLPDSSLDLPFKCTVVALAPSVLQAASLDPASQARHLLRVTLPTSGYEAPINDPLTGPGTPLPRPRWLLDLINDGAVVRLQLKPKATTLAGSETDGLGEGKSGAGAVYTFQGAELPIQDEKRGKHLGLRDGARQNLPQLVGRTTSQGCISLEKPVAVAMEFMKEGVRAEKVEEDRTEGSSEQEVVAEAEVKPAMSPDPRPPLHEQTRYSYNFWKYPRLPRFTTSAPTTAVPSPTKLPNPSLPSTSVAGSAAPSAAGAATTREEKPSNLSVALANKPAAEAHSRAREPPTGILRPMTSLPGLVVACLVCLLLGSLLRSLLSEADFVIYKPLGAGVGDAEMESWRELKRLAEWRIGWDRDLVIAIARRG